MRHLFQIAVLGIVAFSANANAAVSTFTGPPDETTADPFQGATGSAVTGVPLYPGSSLSDLFGGNVSTVEQGHTIFNGSGQSTFTFSTASPVTISGYNLYASGGGGDGRELSSFQVLVSNGNGGFTSLGSDTPTTSDYGNGNGGQILISQSFPAVTASLFEVILNNDSRANAGARLLELNGVAGTVPEPASASLLCLGGFALLGLRRGQSRYSNE